MSKIAFVTEELAVYGRSGGIGAAVFELAVVLRENGHDVDIHYVPIEAPDRERQQFIANAFMDRGIRLLFVDPTKYCWNANAAQGRAYAAFRHLQDYNDQYDFLHFHDYKGLGFFCCKAKKQGITFQSTAIVIQLHGPTRWTTHANQAVFTHQDQLLIDFLERSAIADADHVVSPSAYLVEWMRKNDFTLPDPSGVHVIKNIFSHCLKLSGNLLSESETNFSVRELILFGRHEARKGFVTFCDALDILAKQLEDHGVSVCFIGGLGEINGQPSGVYLTERAKNWGFPIEIRVGFDRTDAMTFLRSRKGAAVVIPSSQENSPYTVVEAIAAGRAVVTSLAGGARELIDARDHADSIVEMRPEALGAHLSKLIAGGAHATHFAESAEAVERQWLAFHENCLTTRPTAASEKTTPKVVVGITHFERPRKVIGAIMSVMRQTYDNIELVVVDDGSRSPKTIDALPSIEKLVERAGGKFIRRDNGYLGAARNTIARDTQSDFLLFLDDDDLLYPDAVERLVAAGTHTGADIINCLNIYLDETHRLEFELSPELFVGKVSYVPTGGPLSLAHLINQFGAATALIKRSFFDKIGGYTEIKGVGYEDYELYVRAAQQGATIEILPLPLYLYEVGKPSMISRTSRVMNKKRIVDAIEISRNHDQWSDAIELAAGIECLEDQKNLVKWYMTSSPHSDLLQEVVKTRHTLDTHTVALAKYAEAVGAPRVAAEWHVALQKIVKQRAQDERRVKPLRTAEVKNLLIESPSPDEFALVTELAGLLKLGRYDDAVACLIRALRETGEISASLIEFVFMLSEADTLDARAASLLISQIEDSFVDEHFTVRLQGAVASLAVIAGMLDKAKALTAEISAAESKQYLDAYLDLQRAFPDRAVERALLHYQKHGHSEGRNGFRTLQRIAYILSKRLKRDVKPWHVHRALDGNLIPSKLSPVVFSRIRHPEESPTC